MNFHIAQHPQSSFYIQKITVSIFTGVNCHCFHSSNIKRKLEAFNPVKGVEEVYRTERAAKSSGSLAALTFAYRFLTLKA